MENFTLTYSLFCLKDILSKLEYANWILFVNAFRIICKTTDVVSSAKEQLPCIKLIWFTILLKGFLEIYGKKYCTPNMHLHLHLKECMIDFGPVYSFWCFSFERFNGVLGSFQTNNRDIALKESSGEKSSRL